MSRTQELLTGKVALITGAGSGIGQEAALVFARHGSKVVLADASFEAAEETARHVREAGGEALSVKADVSCPSEAQALVRQATARYGRLDVAFNNAALGALSMSTDLSEEESWDRVAADLRGLWFCMKHETDQMLNQGGGAIVNNASVAGRVGVMGMPAYLSGKHGVLGLTRAVAREYGARGIRVNAVCPGVLRTPLLDELAQSGYMDEVQLVGAEPRGNLRDFAKVAEAAAWLCSDSASFMMGHVMEIDAGLVAR